MYTLQIAIQDFIHHCTFEKNLSTKTINSYKTDLVQFTKFLVNKNYLLEMKNITKNDPDAVIFTQDCNPIIPDGISDAPVLIT